MQSILASLGWVALLSDRRIIGSAGQDFGDMEDAERRAVAAELSGEIHQTAEIAAQQHVSGRLGQIGEALGHDAVRDIGIFDAESPAKSAARFGAGIIPDG
jgi:hypothetical protein